MKAELETRAKSLEEERLLRRRAEEAVEEAWKQMEEQKEVSFTYVLESLIQPPDPE